MGVLRALSLSGRLSVIVACGSGFLVPLLTAARSPCASRCRRGRRWQSTARPGLGRAGGVDVTVDSARWKKDSHSASTNCSPSGIIASALDDFDACSFARTTPVGDGGDRGEAAPATERRV